MNELDRVEACAKLSRELGVSEEHEKSIEDIDAYFT
jgi:Mg/Co/Ni transporter MgtE